MRACVLPYVCQRSVYRTGEEGGRTEVSSLRENEQYTGTKTTTHLGLAILMGLAICAVYLGLAILSYIFLCNHFGCLLLAYNLFMLTICCFFAVTVSYIVRLFK